MNIIFIFVRYCLAIGPGFFVPILAPLLIPLVYDQHGWYLVLNCGAAFLGILICPLFTPRSSRRYVSLILVAVCIVACWFWRYTGPWVSDDPPVPYLLLLGAVPAVVLHWLCWRSNKSAAANAGWGLPFAEKSRVGGGHQPRVAELDR
jgi:hypothetical protein